MSKPMLANGFPQPSIGFCKIERWGVALDAIAGATLMPMLATQGVNGDAPLVADVDNSMRVNADNRQLMSAPPLRIGAVSHQQQAAPA